MAGNEATGGIFGRVRKRLMGWSKWVTRTAGALAVSGAVGFGIFGWLNSSGSGSTYIAFTVLWSVAAVAAAPVVGLFGKLLAIGGLRRSGRVRVDARGLVLQLDDGRELRLGRGVESGVVVPGQGFYDVQLTLSDGNIISVHVEDEASAEALLDLAGVGSEQRRTRVTWARGISRILAGSFGAFVGLVGGLTAFLATSELEPVNMITLLLMVILPFLLPSPFSRFFAWRELEVGADAIAWRYYFRKKLVPLARVRGVEVRDGELFLRLEDGTDRRFAIPDPGLAEGLRRRIDDALSAMGAANAKGSLFARGELTFAAWVDRVKGVLEKQGAFRDAPVEIADVVGVLEDPDAEPDVRLGAALALHATDDEELKQRVRVVAENCVSPKLRVALEETAQGRALEEEVVLAAREELRLRRPG